MKLTPADLELLNLLLWRCPVVRPCDLVEAIPEQEVPSSDTSEEVQQ